MHVLMIESNPAGISGIKQAIEMGHHVTLLTADRDFYLATNPETENVFKHPLCAVVENRNIFDINIMCSEAKQINLQRKIDGVTTYSEYHVVHTAEIAKYLNLPGMNVEGAKNARFKHRTREKLRHTTIRQPKFIHVNSFDSIISAVEKIGYPCVIKTSDGTAGLNVVFIKNHEDLIHYLDDIKKIDNYGRGVKFSKNLLVEEFIPGDIISVESCVFSKNKIINLGITNRIMSGFPYFIEMGCSYFYDHPLREELFQINTQILNELDIDFGFIHTEFILSAQGPVLCEVNGRLVGGPVPKLMKISSGIDPFIEVIKLALGQEPSLSAPGKNIASCSMFGSPVKGKLNKIKDDGISQLPGFIESVYLKKPGDIISSLSRSNFDWVGYVLFEGENHDIAIERSNAALDKISLDVTIDIAK